MTVDAKEVAIAVAPHATIRELSSSGNRVFRLLEGAGATILKVYATPARERRERHALEAVAAIEGTPKIIDRGSSEGISWIRMTDGGTWTLATLPKNLDAVKEAGALLRRLHDSTTPITNLSEGIDGEYVETHFLWVLDRLERFRRRLGVSAETLEKARHAPAPLSSAPRPSHTRPVPRNLAVAEDGKVTLTDWGWATLAPPEWDLSLATWRFSKQIGQDAAEALWRGYGASFPEDRLRPWIAYHASMTLHDAAEQREGRLDDMADVVADLDAAVSN